MIHDIKVFDKHGKLKEVIDGQKYFNKLYEEGAKSFITERKKTKQTFTCRFCKEKFPRNSPVQYCCKQPKCVYERSLINNPRKGDRNITCVICKKKVTVTHSRSITCSRECSTERNRMRNRIKSKRWRAKAGRDEVTGVIQWPVANPFMPSRNITCVVCNKKVTVQHGRAMTCSSECSLNLRKHRRKEKRLCQK
tara:strand:- start:35 stop:616 length:582 start_codon:yes stop_codon:yes gene_type:complete